MKIKNLFIIMLLFSASAGFGQSMTLTSQDSANSQTFKTTLGSDRTLVFKSLESLIITNANQHYKSTPTSNYTSLSELISLLGTPNFQNANGDVIGYYLKSANAPCSVVFGLNQSHLALYYSIYDCN